MVIDWEVATLVLQFVGAAILLVGGAWLNRVFERRPKLVTYFVHAAANRIPQDNGFVDIYTHSVVLRNSGSKPAKNVRVNHVYLPNFNVYPVVEHRVEDLPGGGRDIVIPTLVPGEQLTISYLYFPPITWEGVNGPVKSDDGLAKTLRVLPTVQYPIWLNRLAQGLMFVGLVAVMYFCIVLFSGSASAVVQEIDPIELTEHIRSLSHHFIT